MGTRAAGAAVVWVTTVGAMVFGAMVFGAAVGADRVGADRVGAARVVGLMVGDARSSGVRAAAGTESAGGVDRDGDAAGGAVACAPVGDGSPWRTAQVLTSAVSRATKARSTNQAGPRIAPADCASDVVG